MLTRVIKMRLAAGAPAASAVGGRQSTAKQFPQPGVARGDAGGGALSPAFAQIAAGNQMATRMPAMPANNGMTMMNPSMPMGSYQMASGQPMMGSGGQVIQPIGYMT